MRKDSQAPAGTKLSLTSRFTQWRSGSGNSLSSSTGVANKAGVRPSPSIAEEVAEQDDSQPPADCALSLDSTIASATEFVGMPAPASGTATPKSQPTEADKPESNAEMTSSGNLVLELHEVQCRVGPREASGGSSSSTAGWMTCSLILTSEALDLVALGSTSGYEAPAPVAGPFAVCPIGFKPDVSGNGQHVLSIPLLHVVDAGSPALNSIYGGSSSSTNGVGEVGDEADAAPKQGSKPNLSERSTFEGSASAFEGQADSGSQCEGFYTSLTPAEEWLVNGIDVGSFDLPPIPLARLPETRHGLPVCRPPSKKENHCSVPVGEFDGSNCKYQALSAAIPPLPPTLCRLPNRTHREMRWLGHDKDRLDVLKVQSSVELQNEGLPLGTHVLVVWTAGSESLARSSGQTRRLQQGVPVYLCFRLQEDADELLKVILRLRGAKLAGSSSTPGGSSDPVKGSSPRFGSSP